MSAHDDFNAKWAAYQQALQAWKDGGRKGDPPPRPVHPHTPGWQGLDRRDDDATVHNG